MVQGSLKPKLPMTPQAATLRLFGILAISLAVCANLFNASLEPAIAKGKPKADAGNDASASSSAPSSAPATKDTAPQVVRDWEQRLFFKTYPDEELGARLARVEKRVFGEPIAASNEERLSKLDGLLKEKLAEEAKDKEAEAFRNGTTNGGAQKPAAAVPSAAQKSEEDLERARLQIQAARDEEIAGLLADGVELFRKKRGMQAQEKFEQVLRLDPTNAQANFNLGIIEESMGNFVEALGSYKQAAAKDPDNAEYREAVAAIGNKASAQANSLGRRADLRALAEQANAAWKRGEYYSALDLYQQLDQKEPNRALVKYNIGSIYLMLKDPETALGFYQQAAKLESGDPKYQKAYKDLASELDKGHKEQAKAEAQATREWKEAHGEAPEPKSKKGSNKGTKQSPNVVTTAPGGAGQSQMIRSNAAQPMPTRTSQGYYQQQQQQPQQQQPLQQQQYQQPMQQQYQQPQQMQPQQQMQPMQQQMMQQPNMMQQQPMQQQAMQQQPVKQQPTKQPQHPTQQAQRPPQQQHQQQQTGIVQNPRLQGMNPQQQQTMQQQPMQQQYQQPMQQQYQQPQQQMMQQPNMMQQVQQQQMQMSMPPQQQMQLQNPMMQHQRTQQMQMAMQPQQQMQYQQQPMQQQYQQPMQQQYQQPMQQQMIQQPMQQQMMQQPMQQQPMQQQQYQQPMQQQQYQQPMQQQYQQPQQQMQQPMRQQQQVQPTTMQSFNQTDMQAGSDMMAQFGIVGKSNGEGVTVVKVGAQSRAASAGLSSGDDIKAVDGIQISGKEEMMDILSKVNPAKRIPFLIMRNGNLAVLNL